MTNSTEENHVRCIYFRQNVIGLLEATTNFGVFYFSIDHLDNSDIRGCCSSTYTWYMKWLI